ncbi:hypothetical protein OH809_40235 [Streptomyces sp. NBC_00873]|uniref:hypothetical protein n=1 Tax=unclassified Streptomyces TaxID=2593676 RepID=UPI003863EED5|nr:hypothetical protein OH809_40235 [Streptomyces sp. NBC_00873]WTA41832.1 hypothetical protein OH821_03465 [Streptomyces sp. NBC_00842]
MSLTETSGGSQTHRESSGHELNHRTGSQTPRQNSMDDLFASGGLQITDTATGTTLLPGCCNELDERRHWLEVVDGNGWASFGHDPSPLAERHGEVVR